MLTCNGIPYKIVGECWECTCAHNQAGYGNVKRGGKYFNAHRLVALEEGIITLEQVVRHACDNPPCIRPEHLVAGTQTQNMRDSTKRRRNPRAKLTDEQVAEIKASYTKVYGAQTDLAAKYNVSVALIRKILKGERRQHD